MLEIRCTFNIIVHAAQICNQIADLCSALIFRVSAGQAEVRRNAEQRVNGIWVLLCGLGA
jgi:hypothetical protein